MAVAGVFTFGILVRPREYVGDKSPDLFRSGLERREVGLDFLLECLIFLVNRIIALLPDRGGLFSGAELVAQPYNFRFGGEAVDGVFLISQPNCIPARDVVK